MKWKNGGGETFEIALSPPDSSLLHMNFDWRLSSATVASDGPFSLFPGYERLLVVWQGSGLKLNGEILEPLKVFKFSGDDKMEAELVQGSVRDLGLIYNSQVLEARMQIHHWRNQVKINCHADHTFFVIQGSITHGKMTAQSADCLHVTNHSEVFIDCQDAMVIEISIRSR